MREEFIKLMRGSLTKPIFGQLVVYVLIYNAIALFFPNFTIQWGGMIAIFIVTLMLDMTYWLTALPIAEDAETSMIQVMRSSRSIVNYFSGKHLLILVSMGVMALMLRVTHLLNIQTAVFVYLTLLVVLVMMGLALVTMIFVKNQFFILGIGSFFNVLSIIVLCRMLLPTWNIPRIPFNPFNELIRGYYDLLYPPVGAALQLNLTALTVFAVGFYLVCAALFYKLTYRNGFML
ncbi:MAG: hypothetical protein A4E53_02421 [Pelotomaculum sp. PtaB.Bin104]|nr:MAG: hypothetical protein A4E53_02421 [Pelotomaculum sp. PtaB.Bin104]